MAKKYKVWLHLEEIDEEHDVYKTLDDEVLPLPVSIETTKEAAISIMEQLHVLHYTGCKCNICHPDK